MGSSKKDVEARASKFVRAIVRKLVNEAESASTSVLFDPDRLEALLQRAVGDLPEGELRTAVECDLPRFASLLRDAVKEARPDLVAWESNAENEGLLAAKEADSLREDLLKISQGSILTDAAFAKAVQAVVVAAEKGAGESDQSREWISSCRRLLGSRSNAPLALWWAYAAIELQCLAGSSGTMERVVVVLSSAKTLMGRLKALSAGRINAFTAIAVLAPVVATLFDAACILSSQLGHSSNSSGPPSKMCRKAVKSLKSTCEELLGSIAIYSSRNGNFVNAASTSLEDLSIDFRGLVLAAKGIKMLTGYDKCNGKGFAKVFPLSSKGLRKSSTFQARDMKFWASVVSAEVVLMRLLVEILERRGKCKGTLELASHDFAGKLKFLAVHGASAIGADVLMDLMMEPKLPVGDVLNSQEEAFLRGMLYETILVDPPQFKDLHLNQPSEDDLRKAVTIFIKKVALARRAVEYYRSHGDRTKAVDLSSRLLTFNIPPGFTGWLQAQKIKQGLSQDLLKDSRALIGWLTHTADDRTFASILAKCTPQAGNKIRMNEHQLLTTAFVGKAGEIDDIFFVDTKGESVGADEDSEPKAANKTFVNAAESMRGLSERKKRGKVLFDRHDLEIDERAENLSERESAPSSNEEDDDDDDFNAMENLGKKLNREVATDSLKDSVEAVLAERAEVSAGPACIANSDGVSPRLEKSEVDMVVDKERARRSSTASAEVAANGYKEEPKARSPDMVVDKELVSPCAFAGVEVPAAEEREEHQQLIQDKEELKEELQEPIEDTEELKKELQEPTEDKEELKEELQEPIEEKEELKEPMTPKPSEVLEPALSMRCTRSGRKYGDFLAPRSSNTPRKKPRVAKAAE